MVQKCFFDSIDELDQFIQLEDEPAPFFRRLASRDTIQSATTLTASQSNSNLAAPQSTVMDALQTTPGGHPDAYVPLTPQSLPPASKCSTEDGTDSGFRPEDFRRFSGRATKTVQRFGEQSPEATTPTVPRRKRSSIPKHSRTDLAENPKSRSVKRAKISSSTKTFPTPASTTPTPPASTSPPDVVSPSSSGLSPVPSSPVQGSGVSGSNEDNDYLPDVPETTLQPAEALFPDPISQSLANPVQAPKEQLEHLDDSVLHDTGELQDHTADAYRQLLPRIRSTSPPPLIEESITVLSEPSERHPPRAVPPALDKDYYERLLAASKRIMHKTPMHLKPLPRGEPVVWAPTRQQLCETVLYFQSWQSACYISKGVLYSFMFDGISHSRDLIDGDVIIARAGGGMVRDKSTKELQQNKSQMENNQTNAIRTAIAAQNPIVIFAGSENGDMPAKMPHRYQALGWFKPTHIWAEQSEKKGQAWTNYKYRFEKLRYEDDSWWMPKISEQPDTNPDTMDVADEVTADTTTARYHERKDSAQSPESVKSGAGYNIGDFDGPVSFTCNTCNHTSDQVYLISWMCLQPQCQHFFRLPSGEFPDESSLNYDPRFLKQKTPWVSDTPPYPLRPALPDPSAQLGESVSFAMTRGMCCPNCGKCNSRTKWKGWYCECGFSHTPPHPTIPASSLRDSWHPVGNLYAQSHDWADSHLKTSVRFSHNYRIVTYEIPGLEDCSISHLIANKTVNEEAKGPNDMFHALQEQDCGLERRQFSTGMEGYMTSFSNNRGMPYKFVAKGASLPFESSPWPLTETRSRLNWASRLVLDDKFGKDQEFNELLTLGYFEQQNIHYHDDGESGLGETVSSLSLGFPADMLFRLKTKHWNGVSTSGVLVHKKPIPGSMNYVKRLEAYEKLKSVHGDATPKPDALKRIATMLNLQVNNRERKSWLRMRLSHGDIVVMHGAQLQEYFEHSVEPMGALRFAMTCRTILPDHLGEDEMPEYDVGPDDGHYDGSVFPSTYRNDTESNKKEDDKVDQFNQRQGREDRESRYESATYRKGQGKTTRYEVDIEEERRPRQREDIRIYSEDRRAPRDTRIEIEETRYREPRSRHIDAHIEVDNHYSPADRLEADFRQRTVPLSAGGWEDKSTRPNYIERDIEIEEPRHKRDMGYYDEDGHYHSFRHGVQRAADRILHPIHGGDHHHHHHRHRREDVVIEDREIPVTAPRRTEVRETVRYADRGAVPNTVTIPCHHIRIGDLVILQGRPCQVIRITTSQHTGQHRYLGVDLFTKELHEESSFVSNPSPSVVVQNMLGPVFKQYRVLDIRSDGRIVAMTETGDVKQGLPVLDQSALLSRIEDTFNNGRGSVRVLVINDEGREMVVDYKIVHGSRL
ncbi:2OG-Fe(II) oxygenase-like protein 5 [Elsinoe fawcettii]|nr:2OG-Fe(II) oxygenase-like protein 5 [Elsinoe fawcettii]